MNISGGELEALEQQVLRRGRGTGDLVRSALSKLPTEQRHRFRSELSDDDFGSRRWRRKRTKQARRSSTNGQGGSHE
jgi:hypothetical protein